MKTADLVTFTEEILNWKLYFFAVLYDKSYSRILQDIYIPGMETILAITPKRYKQIF